MEPAAEQVEAGISPAHETKVGTSSASFYKRLHWGGGRTSIYRIVYNDGITDAIVDNNANYYARDYTRVYSKSSVLSQRTWNTELTVTNGPTVKASGSVTLRDR